MISTSLSIFLIVFACFASTAFAQPLKTQLVQSDGKWQLLRDGKPYLIKGAGGSASKTILKEIGGNSFRTWGADHLDQQLHEAQKLGLSVCVGIWLGQERHGFKYDSAEQVSQQLARAHGVIEKYKDHPAVLMWGIGNEMEGYGKGDNPKIWQAVNDIAKLAHQLDPNHPTMTVIAEIGGERVRCIHQYCPDIDIVGIKTYGGISSIPKRYRAAGGIKPYVITEAGPPGTWETKKNDWEVVPELTSTQKGEFYRRGWVDAVESQPGLALGEYAFNWGNKQEMTATWFGMFLIDGTRLEAVDVMQQLWTGKPPANRCPKIDPIQIVGSPKVAPGARVRATVKISDPDGDPLKVEWVLHHETTEHKIGGDHEDPTAMYPEAIVSATNESVELKMPAEPGGYRLYAYARDGKGSGASANVTLLVTSH